MCICVCVVVVVGLLSRLCVSVFACVRMLDASVAQVHFLPPHVVQVRDIHHDEVRGLRTAADSAFDRL
jgi:hypothetical protein